MIYVPVFLLMDRWIPFSLITTISIFVHMLKTTVLAITSVKRCRAMMGFHILRVLDNFQNPSLHITLFRLLILQ